MITCNWTVDLVISQSLKNMTYDAALSAEFEVMDENVPCQKMFIWVN